MHKMSDPAPKQEVTIDMIADINRLYTKLYNICTKMNTRIDNVVKLSEETANLLLIIGSSKGGEATSEFGSKTRKQYKKLLIEMEKRENE